MKSISLQLLLAALCITMLVLTCNKPEDDGMVIGGGGGDPMLTFAEVINEGGTFLTPPQSEIISEPTVTYETEENTIFECSTVTYDIEDAIGYGDGFLPSISRRAK